MKARCARFINWFCGLNEKVAAVSANTAVATSNAYNAGYTAGASTSNTSSPTNKPTNTTTTAVVAPSYTVGQIVASLPAGCITPTVQGTTYYLCGNTWSVLPTAQTAFTIA